MDMSRMPQNRLEKLPGETEVEFSERAAKVQAKLAEGRKAAADTMEAESPLVKFARVFEKS